MSHDTPPGSTPPYGVPAAGGALTCYRHPGRETYLRCTRCDRPICPQCAEPASVGFHCPQCRGDDRRTQRTARTTFGGKVVSHGSFVTEALIAINVVMFLLQQTSSTFGFRFAIIPGFADQPFVYRGYNYAIEGVVNGEYYRLVTGMFLHANIMHILFNMWALWVVGPQLERLLGRVRFLALYLLGGLGGSALVYLTMPGESQTLGASGAIFALFGALFVFARRLHADLRWIGGIIAVNLVITFVIPGISWQGHLGGLVTGAALGAAYAYAPRRMRTPVQLGASVLVALIIVAVVAGRTMALT